MTRQFGISVLINTLNEEANIGFAIRSVISWCDEIILVDMESDDSTVAIAQAFGDKVKIFTHRRMGYADPARQFALENSSYAWVFTLDADEVIPPSVAVELIRIAKSDNWDAVSIPWLNYVLGAPINSGWGPDVERHIRFFRYPFLSYSGDVHNYAKLTDNARLLNLQYKDGYYIAHFSYKSIEQFVRKMNQYTAIEAEQFVRSQKKYSVLIFILKGCAEFFRRYVLGRGYKDGWRGFYLSLFMLFYKIMVGAKVQEIRAGSDFDSNTTAYAKEADRILKGDT